MRFDEGASIAINPVIGFARANEATFAKDLSAMKKHRVCDWMDPDRKR